MAAHLFDDAPDLRLEAHVEHPVGLVEREEADRRQRDLHEGRKAAHNRSRPGVMHA